MLKKYRLYVMANSWLSGKQKGIQSQHVATTLMWQAHDGDLFTPEQNQAIYEWAKFGPTTILLEGGSHANLAVMFYDLDGKSKQHGMPVTIFREDQESLNGAITAVCILVPEEVYASREVLSNGAQEYVRGFLKSLPLAN